MASEGEIFSVSGPHHLSTIDWENTFHRRSIAASLVQGVFVLERDCQEGRQGPQALAPPWWDFFHFQLLRVLVDDVDLSFFGAIYELKFSPPYFNPLAPNQNPPRYVIAFRGTITKSETRSEDFKLDFKLIHNELEHSSRFRIAMQAVHNTVAVAGAPNVWLAGHSLGSAIALLARKNMAKMGCPLETYLFSPPFVSAPIEKIKNEKLKHGIRFTGSLMTAGLAVAVNGYRKKAKKVDQFIVLSAWEPFLFVNLSDPISAEYIGYFEHREKMAEFGAGGIGRLATQHSIMSLLSGAMGRDSEPLHLLPSAYLTVNLNPSQDFKQAHGIYQWWRPHIQWQSKLYKLKS